MPLTWEAFLDYRFGAMSLSATEVDLLALLHAGGQGDVVERMQQKGWLERQEATWKANREAKEFAAKLQRLGLALPWEA